MIKFNRLKSWLLCTFTTIMVGAISLAISLGFNVDVALAETTGITDISLSLQEDIVIRIHTDATIGDGSKVVVDYNQTTYDLTYNANGVFCFAGVTPQNFNDTLSATLYSANAEKIGETYTFSVRDYLESVLELDFENSGCKTVMQYTAMRELVVNMLNYGTAAQIYTNESTDDLANKNLTDEQKNLATETIQDVLTDKQVVGDAWVGVGVRFDYKLGLYFVFEAESLNGITATVAGKTVIPDVYDADKNYYVIRYNNFNAINMNDVITAKLTFADASEQTFTYSIRSYVYAKGSENNALANLVNATYAYGFAAVAYSADYIFDAPSFESAGKLTIYDDRGYDFSHSQYGSVVLPALNTVDYTTTVGKTSGSDVAPVITTTYVFNNPLVDFSYSINTENALRYNDGSGLKWYSEYTYTDLNSNTVNVTYNAETGYTYKTTERVTLKEVRTLGVPLTVIGDINIDVGTGSSSSYCWPHNVGLIVGTTDEQATVTVDGTGSTYNYPLGLWNGADLTVSKGSELIINSNSSKYGIGNNATDSIITVDGTLTLANIYTKSSCPMTIVVNGEMNLNASSSFIGAITVNGTLNGKDNFTLKSGSNISLGETGVMSVGKATAAAAPSLNIAGTLDLTGALTTSAATNVTVEEGATFKHSSALTLTTNSTLLVDGTMTVGGNFSLAGAHSNDSSYEYGVKTRVYVRKGNLTVNGTYKSNSLQIGSERDGYSGTLTIASTDNAISYPSTGTAIRYLFSKGTLNLSSSVTGKTAIAMSSSNSNKAYLVIGKEMVINTTSTFGNFIGIWNNKGNYVIIHEEATLNLHENTSHFIRYTASTTATTVMLVKTISANVDGVEKTVNVANLCVYNTGSGTAYHETSANVFPTLTDGAEITSTSTTKSIPMYGTYTLSEDGTTYYQING